MVWFFLAKRYYGLQGIQNILDAGHSLCVEHSKEAQGMFALAFFLGIDSKFTRRDAISGFLSAGMQRGDKLAYKIFLWDARKKYRQAKKKHDSSEKNYYAFVLASTYFKMRQYEKSMPLLEKVYHSQYTANGSKEECKRFIKLIHSIGKAEKKLLPDLMATTNEYRKTSNNHKFSKQNYDTIVLASTYFKKREYEKSLSLFEDVYYNPHTAAKVKEKCKEFIMLIDNITRTEKGLIPDMVTTTLP